MDLRSEAFWPWLAKGSRTTPRYPRLRAGASCEVAVVGCGFVGALVTLTLARAGIDCVALDRREPGCGSTAASTAMVLYDLDQPLVRLRAMRGRRAADRAYLLHRRSVRRLARLAPTLPGRVPWIRCPALYLASRPADAALLRREAAARRGLGIGCAYLTETALRRRFGFERPGAILSSGSAVTDPFVFTHAMLRAAKEAGARVFGRTWAVRYEPGRGGFVLRTRGGAVRAHRVVIAAGYEASVLLPRRLCRLRSTYAIATEPLRRAPWPAGCAIWETARPYLYLRPTRDHRLVVGGADGPWRGARERDRLIGRKAAALERSVRRLLPGLNARPAFRWAGTFAETADGMGYIDSLRSLPGALFTLGYGANGMTFAPIAAEAALAWARGRRSADAGLFSFGRAASAGS